MRTTLMIATGALAAAVLVPSAPAAAGLPTIQDCINGGGFPMSLQNGRFICDGGVLDGRDIDRRSGRPN
ncbi:hypothetical protein ACQEU3_38105 [Spirillospora sp. CA-253888]